MNSYQGSDRRYRVRRSWLQAFLIRRAPTSAGLERVVLGAPDDESDGGAAALAAVAAHYVAAMVAGETARDLVLGSFNVYSTLTSQRTNDTMKILTLVTVLLLPGSGLPAWWASCPRAGTIATRLQRPWGGPTGGVSVAGPTMTAQAPEGILRVNVVGARFRVREDAERALHDLRSSLDIGPGDAETQPMGTTDYADPTEGTLLAGHFRPERLPLVEEVIERHGGEILFEASENDLGG